MATIYASRLDAAAPALDEGLKGRCPEEVGGENELNCETASTAADVR